MYFVAVKRFFPPFDFNNRNITSREISKEKQFFQTSKFSPLSSIRRYQEKEVTYFSSWEELLRSAKICRSRRRTGRQVGIVELPRFRVLPVICANNLNVNSHEILSRFKFSTCWFRSSLAFFFLWTYENLSQYRLKA